MLPNGRDELLVVGGIFDIGNKDLNRRWVFVTLPLAQSLLDLPGGVSNLDLTVADIFDAQAIADRLRGATGLTVDSWMQTNAQLSPPCNQTVSNNLIRSFVVIIVALGIASVLVVSVVQKQKEIGILRAMGASRSMILQVFLIQGALVGAVGSVVGSLLAFGLLEVFSRIYRNADGSPLFAAELEPRFILMAALVATGVGLASALIPPPRRAHGPGAGDPLMNAPPVIQLAGLTKPQPRHPVETEVLHGLDLAPPEGGFAALIGPSGSGKSTLLNIIGLLERPTGGRLSIAGRDTATLSEAESPRCAGAHRLRVPVSTTCRRPSAPSRT